MGKGKPKHKQTGKTPRQRLFTNEFKKGDLVSIIREHHGWHDGRTTGRITELSPGSCTVRSEDGAEYQIDHPRDISKIR